MVKGIRPDIEPEPGNSYDEESRDRNIGRIVSDAIHRGEVPPHFSHEWGTGRLTTMVHNIGGPIDGESAAPVPGVPDTLHPKDPPVAK
jgi:hypothetical protein